MAAAGAPHAGRAQPCERSMRGRYPATSFTTRILPYHCCIMSRQPAERPSPPRRGQSPDGRNPLQPQEQNWRWAVVALVALVAAAVILPGMMRSPKREPLGYGALMEKAKAGQ